MDLKLKKFSEDNEIDFLVSPFDLDSAKELKKNNIFAYKIASSELTNLKNDKLHCSEKPIFISTGMSDLKDVQTAISICKK